MADDGVMDMDIIPPRAARLRLANRYGTLVHVGREYADTASLQTLFCASRPVLLGPDSSADDGMTLIDPASPTYDPGALDTDVTYLVLDEAVADALEEGGDENPPLAADDAVRLTKDMQDARRAFIRDHYSPAWPNLYAFDQSMLHPFAGKVLAALVQIEGDDDELPTREAKESAKKEVLDAVLTTLSDETRLVSFPLLAINTCMQMIEELEAFEASGMPCIRPNSMNNFGLVLGDLGFDAMLDDLMASVVSPLASVLYPEFHGDQLDSQYGFVVQYRLNEDRELAFHVDNADVTLNVCLGTSFGGGDLLFRGWIFDPSTHSESLSVPHAPGTALLHLGRHRHEATPIVYGERYNLILWCSSSVSTYCSHHHHYGPHPPSTDDDHPPTQPHPATQPHAHSSTDEAQPSPANS